MATGVFNTARTGHSLRSRKRRGRMEPIDRFAECLSHHGSVTQASSDVGVTTSSGYAMFRRICAQLGVPTSPKGDRDLES